MDPFEFIRNVRVEDYPRHPYDLDGIDEPVDAGIDRDAEYDPSADFYPDFIPRELRDAWFHNEVGGPRDPVADIDLEEWK